MGFLHCRQILYDLNHQANLITGINLKKKFKLLLIYPDLLFINSKFSMGSLLAKEDAMQHIQKIQS